MDYPGPIKSVEPFRNQLKNIRLLSPAREHELAVRYKETGDVEAGNELVVSHMPLVMGIAMKYRHYQLPLEDLIQEGSMGLIRALERFDPYKGFRFVSFAVWWVKAYIQNFIIKTVRLVRLGTTQAQRKLFYRIGQIDQVSDAISKADRIRELAQDLRVKEDEEIDMEARMKAREWSLDEIPGDPWLKNRQDLFHHEAEGQEEQFARVQSEQAMRRLIQAALKKLDARERFILRKRFLEEPSWTLRQLAEHFGLTRERVRQLQARALRKLRKELEAWGAADLMAA